MNEQKTLDTGISVFSNINRMVDASDKLMRLPYLIHIVSINIRTLPSRDLERLSILMARSVENRRNALALMGFDALKMRYNEEGEAAFRLNSIATTYSVQDRSS